MTNPASTPTCGVGASDPDPAADDVDESATKGKKLAASDLLGNVKNSPEWCLAEELPAALDRYEQLWLQEDPEEDCYKSKYEAREMLEAALLKLETHLYSKKLFQKEEEEADKGNRPKNLEALVQDAVAENAELEKSSADVDGTSGNGGNHVTIATDSSAPIDKTMRERLREQVAYAYLLLGKNYYYCEEVAAGEQRLHRSLYEYLGMSDRGPLVPKLQDVLNQLGMLWVHRQNHAKALSFLRRAQVLYQRRPASLSPQLREHSDNYYTLTQFYLAQAYGAAQDAGLSAKYCAETLQRQLLYNTRMPASSSSGNKTAGGRDVNSTATDSGDADEDVEGSRIRKEREEKDPFDVRDWCRNCVGLAEYFANKFLFFTAEYVVFAALVLLTDGDLSLAANLHEPEEMLAEVRKSLASVYSNRLVFSKTSAELKEREQILEAWVAFAKEEEESRKVIKGGGAAGAAESSAPASGSSSAGSAEQGSDEKLDFGKGKIYWDAKFVREKVDDVSIVYDERFPATVSLLEAEKADGSMAGEKLLTEAEAEAAALAPSISSSASSGSRGSAASSAGRSVVRLGTKDKLFPVQLAVYFPALHGKIEAKMNNVNRDFFAARIAASSLPVPTSLALAAGVRYEESKELFKMANHYLAQALSHFQLDGWCTDHVKLQQEVSSLYRHLCFWETDSYQRRSAMFVRRQKLLQPLLSQLSKQHFRNYWRQLCFEVGEILQELSEVHLKELQRLSSGPGHAQQAAEGSSEVPAKAPKLAQKVNQCILQSRGLFKEFVATYEGDERADVTKLEEEDARAYAHAKINGARMASKFIGLDKKSHVDMLKTAIDEYEALKKWFAAVSTPAEKLGLDAELHLVREMCSLLPVQLERVLRAPE